MSGMICSLPGLCLTSRRNCLRNCNALIRWTFIYIVKDVDVIDNCFIILIIAE